MILKDNAFYAFTRFKNDDFGFLSDSWGEIMWDSDINSADLYTTETLNFTLINVINESLRDGYRIEFVDTVDGKDVVIHSPERINLPFKHLFKNFSRRYTFPKDIKNLIKDLYETPTSQ